MKQNITVVSLGPGDPELLTAQSLNTMKKAKRLIFRTVQHPVYAALTEAGVQSTSLDDYYDRYEDFDEMHRDMAKALWTEAEHHAVVFAVLDAGKLNQGFVVFCKVKMQRLSYEIATEFARIIRDIPEVTECYNISGAFDYLLKIHASDMKHYQEFILNVLGRIDHLGSLESVFVMDELKHEYGIHL